MKCESDKKRPRIEREESRFQINDSQQVFCLLFLLWFSIAVKLVDGVFQGFAQEVAFL